MHGVRKGSESGVVKPAGAASSEAQPSANSTRISGARRGSGRRRRLRVWRVYLVVGILAIGLYFALPEAAQSVLYWLFGPMTVASIFIGLRLYRPRHRMLWWLLALSQLSRIAGDLAFFSYPALTGRQPPFPSIADIFYLGAYPLAIGAILLVLWRRGEGRDLSSLIDALIVTVGVGLPAQIFLIEPYASEHSLTLAERSVSIAYSLFALLTFAVAARLMTTHKQRTVAYHLFLWGLLSSLSGDIIYGALTLVGFYHTGSPVDSFWLLSYVMLGAAALHPTMPFLSEPAPEAKTRRTVAWWRLTLIVISALMAPAMLVIQQFLGDHDDTFVIAGGAVVMFLLVLLRMEGLVRRLDSASSRYEQAASREKVLRRAGARLLTASNREAVYRAALEAILDLAGDPETTRTWIATGSPDNLCIVAAAGDRASDVEGIRFDAQKLPEQVRMGFSRGEVVEIRGADAASMRAVFEFETKAGDTLIRPLRSGEQGGIAGVIWVATDRSFRREMRDGFDTLSSQIALALESLALAEDLYQRKSEARFRSLIQNSSDIIMIISEDGEILYQSPSMAWTLGYDPEGRFGLNALGSELVHPDDLVRLREATVEAVGNPESTISVEARMLHRDGSWRHMEAAIRSLLGDPNVDGILITARDVTERKKTEEALREAEFRYRTLVEQIPVVTYINPPDASGPSLYISPQLEAMVGYSWAEGRENPGLWDRIIHPEDRERVFAEEERTNATGEPFKVEYRMITREGRIVWMHDEAVLVRDEEGRPRFWQGVMVDITERKELEGQLSHQAFHDPLTGLPNRILFRDRLEVALARRSRSERPVTVLFVDLDDFKNVNDSLGHDAGDRLLVEVARRFLSCVRPGDTVARLGGDEFAFLIEEDLVPSARPDAGSEAPAAALVAERVLASLSTPFSLRDKEVTVHPSVGIAVDDGSYDAGELLRNADVAMYAAKVRGKGRCEFYDPTMHAAALERLGLAEDLRQAVANRELFIHYQPVISLKEPDRGRVRGVEALVRWRHPHRGTIPPGEFIPLAEETEVIVEIGRLVLEEACRQVREWQTSDPEGKPLTLSVNLSARQFRQPDLARRVSEVLHETGLPASSLRLEITESAAMDDVDSALEILQQLKSLGVKTAIDDFGTGYSSLSYLGRLPVDTLKIDRSFVGRLGKDPESPAIVSTTVNLGRTLNLEVVAEGVETFEQLALLEELGCDLAQGYYFTRPLPPEDIQELLSIRNHLQVRDLT